MRVLTTLNICLVIAVVALLGCQSPAPRSATSAVQARAAIEGTWTAVSAERNGKRDNDVKGNRLTLAGNSFVIERGGATLYRGSYTTDPGKQPAHIDFHHTGGALSGATWRGVYSLQGDTLTVADNAPDMNKARPAALAAPADSGHVVVVFTRVEH